MADSVVSESLKYQIKWLNNYLILLTFKGRGWNASLLCRRCTYQHFKFDFNVFVIKNNIYVGKVFTIVIIIAIRQFTREVKCKKFLKVYHAMSLWNLKKIIIQRFYTLQTIESSDHAILSVIKKTPIKCTKFIKFTYL